MQALSALTHSVTPPLELREENRLPKPLAYRPVLTVPWPPRGTEGVVTIDPSVVYKGTIAYNQI